MKACGATSVCLLLVAISTACAYDPDERCGPNQRLDDYDRCVCMAGTVPAARGCAACPEGELAAGDACECAPGSARPEPGRPCAPLPSGLGVACDGDAECLDVSFGYCQLDSLGAGYCTSTGCSSSADCAGGYACELSKTPSFCRRPPTGLGHACESAADCATLEATYCESFQSHQCMVEGCSVSDDDCFEGYACCDLTTLGLAKTLCVPEGKCPT